MSAVLILAALNQCGRSLTASAIHDQAVAVAMDAGWPRRAWAELTPQKIAALLRGMEGRGEVLRDGTQPENGRLVPLWGLATYDRQAALPTPPDPEVEDHPLHGMTRRQQFALFDALDASLAAYARMHRETVELVARHHRDLAELTARTKRELIAAGLEA